MNGKRLTSILALVAAGSLIAEAAENKSFGGLLQFFDGSALHGRLEAIEPAKGLRWEHPSARAPLEFRAGNVASIQFDQFTPVDTGTNNLCRFRFINGDEILGNIKTLKNGEVDFETWFARSLKAPVSSLEAIQFSAKGFAMSYEGPRGGTDGWTVGKGAKAWQYKDGGFVSTGPDFLGRDLKLTGNSSFAFDLNWRGSFSLSLTMFTDSIDRFDYNTSSYMFFFGVGAVSVQRVQPGVGAIMFGQAQLPSMLRKSKMRFEIRANKEEGTLTLLADGALIQKWRDNNGFNGKGAGVVFCSQMDTSTLRISNIRATENAGLEYDEPNMGKEDILYLANHDRANGKLESFNGGKLTFSTAATTLEIPSTRINQILFSNPRTNRMALDPWLLKARFAAGETVSLKLAKWERDNVTGVSPNFGAVQFRPESIKELQLNLDRARPSSDTVLTDENLIQPDE